MAHQIILTAYAEQPSLKGVKALSGTALPKIVYLTDENIQEVSPKKNAAGTIVGSVVIYGKTKRVRRKYLVGERPAEIEVARDPGTSNVYAQSKNLGISASGAASNTSLAMTAYLNVVTGATVTTHTGVRLPSASGTQKALVLINAASTALTAYPSISEFINAGASDVGLNIPVNSRVHFYASASNTWKSASV